jgi:hypothetical protein
MKGPGRIGVGFSRGPRDPIEGGSRGPASGRPALSRLGRAAGVSPPQVKGEYPADRAGLSKAMPWKPASALAISEVARDPARLSGTEGGQRVPNRAMSQRVAGYVTPGISAGGLWAGTGPFDELRAAPRARRVKIFSMLSDAGDHAHAPGTARTDQRVHLWGLLDQPRSSRPREYFRQ